MSKWLTPVLLCAGLVLAALGMLLFVRPLSGVGGMPPLAVFSLATLSLAAVAFRSSERTRRLAAAGAVLCVLAGAGTVLDRYRVERLARAERRAVPPAFLAPVDRNHVVGEHLAEAGVGNRLGASGSRNRGGVRDAGEIDRRGGGRVHVHS